MNTPDYINILNEIRSRVGQYTKIEPSNAGLQSKISIPVTLKFSNINYKSPIFYIIPSIAIFILLTIWKPDFVTTDTIDKDNNVSKKRNFKTILIISLVAGTLLDMGMFAYFRKKK